jgi:hypothetical protein
MPKIVKNLSAKNTKQEIVSAYETLVSELNSQQPLNNLSDFKPQDIINDAPEEVIEKMSKLKFEVSTYISGLIDKMSIETENLKKVKNTIKQQNEELLNIYKIKTNADTLKNIIKMKEEQEIKANQALDNLKGEFAVFKIKEETKIKEELLDLKRTQEREEEDYKYQLKQKRQTEEDKYTKERQEIEAELKLKLETLAIQEDELKQLRKDKQEFNILLEREIAKAIKQTSGSVTKELENEFNLNMKEIEGEKKVSVITIENLQKNIKNYEEEIKSLKHQLLEATKQIKDIAVSVIENNKTQLVTESNVG